MPNPQSQYAYLLTDVYAGASVFHEIKDLADWLGTDPVSLQEAFEALHQKHGANVQIGVSGGTMQRVALNPTMSETQRTERLACFLAGLMPNFRGERRELKGTQQLGRSLGLSETTIEELTNLMGTTTSDRFHRLVSSEAQQAAEFIEDVIERRFEAYVDEQLKRLGQIAGVSEHSPLSFPPSN